MTHTHDPDPESGICRANGCEAVDYRTYEANQRLLAGLERLGEELLGADMQVITAGRGAGKTHDLVRWLGDGEKRLARPFWSRVLVVPLMHHRRFYLSEHRDAWARLIDKGGVPERVVFTAADLRRGALKGCGPHIKVALDDAGTVLAEALGGRWPDLVAIDGEVLRPGVLSGRIADAA